MGRRRPGYTRVKAPSGASTSFSYDGNGNVTGVTDARGNSTGATYDSMDRESSWTDALGHSAHVAYDLDGNLTQATDRNGASTTYAYDALNRRTSISDDSTRTLSYDAANRLTQITDSTAGTITNGYDSLDRLTSQTTPQGDIGYAYDAAGRRVSMSTGGQADTAYSYDDADRPTGITRGDLGVSLAYDSTGRPSGVALPGGVSESYAYDAASQLTQIAYQHGGSALGELDYAYDSAGRRTAAWGDFARTGLPDALSSASYDAANRLVGRGGQSFTYDNDGNLTNDGAATYQWNLRGQLTGLSSAASSASFAYDALGRRTSRTVNGQTTSYRYDGANPIREQTGDATATLLGGLGLDANYARTDADGTSSYLTDALGSTVALADGSGAVRTTYTYDPFGAPVADGDPSDNAHQYTGRENDSTGLDYLRARYYSPAQARFISEDPLGLAGGDSNLYAYAGGNPISLTDPTGTSPIDDLVNLECNWGDTFTAGGTKAARKIISGENGCDSTSTAGQAGTALGLATGFAFPGLGEADAARVGAMAGEDAARAIRGGEEAGSGLPRIAGGAPILGEGGTQVVSRTLQRDTGQGFRIDVENPAPGVRAGQLHLQTADGRKYIYNFDTNQFDGLPTSLQKAIADDPKVARAIAMGRRYLNVPQR